MAFLRLLIWALLFLIATFCWVVVFEHGLSGFRAGCGEEWQSFRRFLGEEAVGPEP